MLKLPLDLFEIRQSEPAEKKSPTPPVDANANIYRGSIPKKVPEEGLYTFFKSKPANLKLTLASNVVSFK